MKVSVVISTFKAPQWLEKVLWGYECQSFDNFELIVADYGCFDETAAVVARAERTSRLHLYHLRYPSRSMSRAQILNEAVINTDTEYCIFSNDHCIPRIDFVETHMKEARRGRYLTAGTFNLPITTSEWIGRQEISTQFAFELRWLLLNGWKPGWMAMQLVNLGITSAISNSFPWNSAQWNRHNASAFKDDLISVNGFNEACPSPYIDSELNIRLVNKRLEGVAINNRAVCIHLKETEATAEVIVGGDDDCLARVPKDATWVNTGIVKSDRPDPVAKELHEDVRSRQKERSYNS